MNGILRRFYYGGLIFIANRVVARVPSYTARLFFYRRVMKFSIGSHSSILMDVWFDTKGKGSFAMGHNSVVNQKCRMDNRGSILIGDYVSISAEVCILTADHDVRSPTFAGRLRRVSIGDFVFIGTRALLLPGVTVGKGAAIGAGSVVTKDVPEFAVVAGNPAKQIGTRGERSLDEGMAYNPLFW